ncbi:MAG: hypothetical protein AAF928_11840 [Myxococcota bacterium]
MRKRRWQKPAAGAAHAAAAASVALGWFVAVPAAADDRGTDIGGGAAVIEGAVRIGGHFGLAQPTALRSSWQRADTRTLSVQAGVGLGDPAFFRDLRLVLEGGYVVSADERTERTSELLPVGFPFYGEDEAGFLRALVRGDVVHTPRFALELAVAAALPVDLDLAKFSHLHLHYARIDAAFRIHLTDPSALVRLDGSSRGFVGSGAYDGTFQHNPQLGLDALLAVSFRRWLIPWRVTIAAGPTLLSDLVGQRNAVYRDAYAGALNPAVLASDDAPVAGGLIGEVKQFGLGVRVMPSFAVTEYAAVSLQYDGQLSGVNARATQVFHATLRTAF